MADQSNRLRNAGETTGRGCEVSFRVRYYETDMMGITHHSNYLRWFEVARTEYLRQAGMTYRSLEESGLGCPVIVARCKYFHSSSYDDLVFVRTWIKNYDGLRLTMSYQVFAREQLICEGETDHAFAYHGRAVSLRRSLPDVHARMLAALDQDRQTDHAGDPVAVSDTGNSGNTGHPSA